MIGIGHMFDHRFGKDDIKKRGRERKWIPFQIAFADIEGIQNVQAFPSLVQSVGLDTPAPKPDQIVSFSAADVQKR